MEPYGEPCYYLVDPDNRPDLQCQHKVAFRVSEYYVDEWVWGYWSCADHVDYLLNWFARNGNYGRVKAIGGKDEEIRRGNRNSSDR